MKKICLIVLGVTFALSFASCDDQKKKDTTVSKAEQRLAHPHRKW